MSTALAEEMIDGEVNQRSWEQPVGDAVWDCAKKYAKAVNTYEFASSLRNRTLSKRRFMGYISAIYPIVVGFNRALIRSLSKVDHVRQSKFVQSLAEQLGEEQWHNQLWRGMLRAHRVDHDALYSDLERYMARFSERDLDQMTAGVIAALTHDINNVSP